MHHSQGADKPPSPAISYTWGAHYLPNRHAVQPFHATATLSSRATTSSWGHTVQVPTALPHPLPPQQHPPTATLCIQSDSPRYPRVVPFVPPWRLRAPQPQLLELLELDSSESLLALSAAYAEKCARSVRCRSAFSRPRCSARAFSTPFGACRKASVWYRSKANQSGPTSEGPRGKVLTSFGGGEKWGVKYKLQKKL